MVVGHIEEFIFSCHYPQIPFVALAFRAMPVTAAVIADMYMRARFVGAFINVSAQH
jgi:hypothetical protein